MPREQPPSLLSHKLTRRRFLALGGAMVASGALSACMGDDDESGDPTPTLVGATRTPDSAIETPQVSASPDAGASPESSPSPAADADLERFMALSRALTGFDDLDDSELGQIYLDSISGDDELGEQLDALYDKAGLDEPAELSLEQLEEAGAFDEDTRPVADAITTVWYTGRYTRGDGETVVATYLNALAWQATGYRMMGPSSCSGATGNWSEPVAA